MKYTLCITRRCNLDCSYCYITKSPDDMPLPLAEKIIDFIFSRTPPGEKMHIGFFGGEPLLRFDLVQKITETIKSNPSYDPERVEIHLVSNGTLLTGEMIDFIATNDVVFGVSCDGPPSVHNLMRRCRNGGGSAAVVEKNLVRAKKSLPHVLVNAVYHPLTFRHLPEVVEYFSSLGLRTISLNPDFSAAWSPEDIEIIAPVYRRVGELYLDYHSRGDPHYINLIDNKILLILKGGFMPEDRCRMGTHELAFGPSGTIYPCERLIGSDNGTHAIGSMFSEKDLQPCRACGEYNVNRNAECSSCGIKEYCMNWCGCSNFFSTGSYDHAGPFLCASERAALSVSLDVFRELNMSQGSLMLHQVGRI